MKVHPLLEDVFKTFACPAPEKCKQRETTCIQFTKCGTRGLCKNPCELCSFWSGCGMSDSKIKDCIKILKHKN